jgi:hypothetical protein
VEEKEHLLWYYIEREPWGKGRHVELEGDGGWNKEMT